MSDAPTERQPWEKMQGEPSEHYAWFLAYRNLGPGRSVDAAYKLTINKRLKARKPKKASGDWSKACAEWNWVDRAVQWDIAMLTDAGLKVMALFTASLEAYAGKVLAALQDDRNRPRGWAGAVEGMRTLANFIPPETFQALCAHTGSLGAGGGGTDSADDDRTAEGAGETRPAAVDGKK
jgi:hypothetical protein